VALRLVLLAAGAQARWVEPGKDADLVIFNGDPLAYQTRVDKVLICGTVVCERKD
jgi:imidazolonepropionase-like amidohydrolase